MPTRRRPRCSSGGTDFILGERRSRTPSGTWKFSSFSSRRWVERQLSGHRRYPMALLRIPDENRTIEGDSEVGAYLTARGIDYEHWNPPVSLPDGATHDELLAAYA